MFVYHTVYVQNIEFESYNTVRLQGKFVFQAIPVFQNITLNFQEEMLVFMNYHSDDISTNNALISVNMDNRLSYCTCIVTPGSSNTKTSLLKSFIIWTISACQNFTINDSTAMVYPHGLHQAYNYHFSLLSSPNHRQ